MPDDTGDSDMPSSPAAIIDRRRRAGCRPHSALTRRLRTHRRRRPRRHRTTKCSATKSRCRQDHRLLTGKGTWDNAFPTLIGGFKSIAEFLDQRKLKPDGRAMMIYTGADDTGFEYQAAVPVRRRRPTCRAARSRSASRPPARPTNSSIAAPMTGWKSCTRRSPISSTRRRSSGGPVHRGICHRSGRPRRRTKLVIDVFVLVK